jgi:LacI family transcriptional regulator
MVYYLLMPISKPTPAISKKVFSNSTSVKAVGVRELAQVTGLSVATISRVLNESTEVSVHARTAVLKAIRQTGYSRNPAARALSTQRSRTIGAIIPTLAHSIFATFLNAIEQELAHHGYALVIATTDGDGDVEKRRAQDLIDLGAEGLIVSGGKRSKEFLKLVKARAIPVVATSIFDPKGPLPTIGYDNFDLGRAAAKHLLELGHRNIAVVFGPLATNDRTVLRLEGVKAAMSQLSEGRRYSLKLFETGLDVVGGTQAAQIALSTDTWRPSAFLCLSDVLALGVLFEAQRRQLRIPTDLSVMGFDDLDWAKVCEPSLTTIALPTEQMGQQAARALVNKLDHGAKVASTCLAANLVLRESTSRYTHHKTQKKITEIST